LLFSLVALLSVSVFAKDKWREVSAAERQMTKGKVEADADAEAIFWEVNINDSGVNLVMEHYIRVKIFTERGREKFSKIDIPYTKRIKIRNIEARVIKPDNSVVEITKEDIFDREIVKADDVKVKAKSFAVPNIEPGVIFEYRYKESHTRGSADNFRMDFQRDIPMQKVTYLFKTGANGRLLRFNTDAQLQDLKRGRYKIELEDMPAVKEEPNMPPEDETRAWLMVYYDSKRNLKRQDKFWGRVGGVMARYYEIKDTLKPGNKIKAAAAEISAGASTDEEKIRKLYDFCKTKIRNLDFDPTFTDEESEKWKANKSDFDTYKKRKGKSYEINKLFASLVDAAGFETRIAFTGDRSKLFFDPSKAHESFIHLAGVGIEQNGRWQYYDPGSPFLPYNTLMWYEQNTSVFLLAYKDYLTTKTRLSNYRDSKVIRNGKFKLLEDGTLEGEATIQYTGHFSHRNKLNNYDSSENAREEALKERINARLSTAELSDIQVLNVSSTEDPFTQKYKITVPNYAQKVGKRIFLQPGFFAKGSESRFTSSDRVHDIYFQFPWSESENIEIELPEGYELDNADAPAPVEDSSKIGMLENNIFFDKKSNKITYKRKFYFGSRGTIYFRKASYPALKALFDSFHKNDTHGVTLRKKAEPQ
jgi:hypothetical protein